MKYFKFWVKECFQINVEGQLEHINVLSGSNISKEDARLQAKHYSEIIEKRIAVHGSKDSYEVAIKEHVKEALDDSNIITVCRYGANILNTTRYTVLDLDDYPVDFFDFFRKKLKQMSKKERIVHKFLERLKKHPELGSDFRIYETAKGIRVIGKKYIEPSGHKYRSLMRKFAVDWVYIAMSQRQGCYRARLTPKPYRMKIQTIRISSPLDCESQAYLDWSTAYEEAASRFSVVKLLQRVGNDFSLESVIRTHDLIGNAEAKQRLA